MGKISKWDEIKSWLVGVVIKVLGLEPTFTALWHHIDLLWEEIDRINPPANKE